MLVFARQQVIRRERLKNEVKLKQLEAEKYQEIDSMKSRFFANISHEFRTPLTLILGPLEKYLNAPGNSPGKQTELSTMYQNALRLLNLVNQLLDLSRFEAGSIKLQVSTGELIQFVTMVMSEFQSIADSKRIQFKLVHEEQTIPLYFDRDKLGKILNNLLANAFKFTPEGGEITVSISQEKSQPGFEDGVAKIQVKDSGIGIPAEHLSKIFDRFYQVDNSLTRAYEGSGIGLALTKELVQLCHGTISVESEQARGSVFTVCLPLSSSFVGKGETMTQVAENVHHWKPEVHEQEDPEAENESVLDHATSILVIEDNADLRAYLKSELATSYHVIEAADGNQGVEMAIQEIPAIIVSDLMMPGKDGMKVCELLKEDERTSHIPIILLTAKAEMESKLQGYRIGADDYIAKPFLMKELQTRIENLIANRKRLRAKYAQAIQLRPSELKIESVEDRFLKKVMNVVEAHISDPSFGLEQFATAVGMSKIQLYRKLKAITQHTPNEFIRDIRLQRANELLMERAGNVAEVAYKVGFKNLSYFSKTFREKFGKTPSELL
jgi:CheY-like chemotaxis protein